MDARPVTDTAAVEARPARLAQLAALLARADRLTVDEAALLRRHVAAELADAALAHRTAGGMRNANRRLRQQLATAEADADRFRQEELGACQTIAAMHAAAVGEVRGPLLGVVEDVTSMRTAYLAQQDRADQLNRIAHELRQQLAAMEASRDTAQQDAAELRNAHRKADATLQRVRDADSLGAALAAVAEHDGIATTSARLQGVYAEAAETVEARLAEQQRAHDIALAEAQQRLDTACTAFNTKAMEVYDVIHRAAQAEQRLAAAHNLASAQARTIGRLLLTDRLAEQLAERNLTAWRSARRRAAAEQAANNMRDARMRHAVQQYAELRVQLDDTEAALADAYRCRIAAPQEH